MSEVKTENPHFTGRSKTENMKRRKVEYMDQLYHVEINQNEESRFIRIIEDPDSNRHTRVVIPMCTATDVVKKVREMLDFAKTYEPKNISQKEKPSDPTKYAHTINHTTKGGRIYYLDLIDAENTLTLRMSYLFGRRRDTIHMECNVMTAILSEIDEFMTLYPSISDKDDYPAPRSQRRQKKNFGERRFPSQRGNFRGNFRRRGAAQNGGAPGTTPQIGEGRRPSALKVVSDPSPVHVVSNAKTFTLEIVEGQNTFFRITEMIGENRKSTLHVPVEACDELQAKLLEMSQKYAQIQKVSPAAATSGQQTAAAKA